MTATTRNLGRIAATTRATARVGGQSVKGVGRWRKLMIGTMATSPLLTRSLGRSRTWSTGLKDSMNLQITGEDLVFGL